MARRMNGSPGKGSTIPDKSASGADRIRARTTLDREQTLAEADQTLSDADQTAADADNTAAARDQANSERDQILSDQDQATADLAPPPELGSAAQKAYELAHAERIRSSSERKATHVDRARTAGERERTGQSRDTVAARRDEQARERDERAAALEASIASVDPTAAAELKAIREQAALDRATAAQDRARAASDRQRAASERTRLEADLLTAHIDGLTGAYRRELGRLALRHEVDRARRGDGRFVLAFVDVDHLKEINDRDGHSAGDRALRAVVVAMREHLRSFDPILRYGGDEFVAGMSETDLDVAEQRFADIQTSLQERSGISISVGLTSLKEGDTVDELTDRADQALLVSRRRLRLPT